MDDATCDFTGDLIDVSGMSLRHLDDLPPSSVAQALEQVLTSNDTGPVAGFSSRI